LMISTSSVRRGNNTVKMNTQLADINLSVEMPAAYRIRVLGCLKASWFDRLEGMLIGVTPPTQSPSVTTLSGTLADQAALVGVLNSLHGLRLVILSVECLDEQTHENSKN
jgi:hypothetical protein